MRATYKYCEFTKSEHYASFRALGTVSVMGNTVNTTGWHPRCEAGIQVKSQMHLRYFRRRATDLEVKYCAKYFFRAARRSKKEARWLLSRLAAISGTAITLNQYDTLMRQLRPGTKEEVWQLTRLVGTHELANVLFGERDELSLPDDCMDAAIVELTSRAGWLTVIVRDYLGEWVRKHRNVAVAQGGLDARTRYMVEHVPGVARWSIDQEEFFVNRVGEPAGGFGIRYFQNFVEARLVETGVDLELAWALLWDRHENWPECIALSELCAILRAMGKVNRPV
jgi:hypothetical protein